MMDFLKGLYARLAPWYNTEEHEKKEIAAEESSLEVKRLAREAKHTIKSYRMYESSMMQSKEKII